MAALGAELAVRGHTVTLVAPVDLVDFGVALGLRTVPIGIKAEALVDPAKHQNSRPTIEYRLSVANQLQSALVRGTRNPDLIVTSQLGEAEAAYLAEVRAVPLILLRRSPGRGIRRFPSLRRRYCPNTALDPFRGATLPRSSRLSRSGRLELRAYSRHLAPDHAGRAPSRPPIGSISLSREQRRLLGEDLPGALRDWLGAGVAPVYFGLDGMPVRDVPAMLATVEAATRRLGVRAVVGTRSSRFDVDTAGLDPSLVRVVRRVDHDQLLPLCLAAVHHGGAGTTAASIRAGLSTVICASRPDQVFWGHQLERLRAGRTLPFAAVTTRRLVATVGAVLADRSRERARELAGRLHQEHAVVAAANLVEAVRRERPGTADPLALDHP
ncbi:glycosyltransferase [Phytohabitans flavus]